MNKKLILASALALCATSTGAFATLLVQEDFNYSADSTNGTAVTGTGLSGTWYGGALGTSTNTGTVTFTSTSLSFSGHFASSGGALQVTATSQYEYGASVAISASLSGLTTFYTSELMQMGTAGRYYSDWVVESRFNSTLTGGNGTSSGRIQVSSYNTSSTASRVAGMSLGNTATTGGSSTLAAGTTYLMVGAYTGDGTNITSSTVYFFDQTSYANYLAAASESNAASLLSTYALFSLTQTGSVALSSLTNLQFNVNGGPTALYDDYRLGTDIGDVVNLASAIPEPATTAAIIAGLSLGAVVFLRRKRR